MGAVQKNQTTSRFLTGRLSPNAVDPFDMVRDQFSGLIRSFRARIGADPAVGQQGSSPAALKLELEACQAELKEYQSLQFVPPGHFYSPIVEPEPDSTYSFLNLEQVEQAGINLRVEGQKDLLFSPEFRRIYDELPFPELKSTGFRFYYENPAYSYSDAITLFFMLRHCNPASIIEVGSGFSSALMLDTVDRFFSVPPSLTFIEPYPQLLRSLFLANDHATCRVIDSDLQRVPLETFGSLGRNDILFIDSTHVAKSGSDVNYVFSQIIPSLSAGVLIHFHDMFSGFEYPEGWISEGRNWNELYVMRSFLQYNSSFEVVLFDELLGTLFPDLISEHYPLMARNKGGSIWLRKLV
jgi:hypothetical protein